MRDLSERYGQAVIGGHLWKDSTSYSQGSKNPPSCWECKIAGSRIVLLKTKDAEWRCFSYHPETSDWTLILPSDATPNQAAEMAFIKVSTWLRELANEISPA